MVGTVLSLLYDELVRIWCYRWTAIITGTVLRSDKPALKGRFQQNEKNRETWSARSSVCSTMSWFASGAIAGRRSSRARSSDLINRPSRGDFNRTKRTEKHGRHGPQSALR